MKTTKTAVILLALVFLIAAGAQSDEKPAKKEISNTQTASCLFKITTTETVLPLNEFAIDYLVRSSGVAGKAAREILDISPDMASELFDIEEIYSVFPDSGGIGGGTGGMGIPPGTTVPGRSYPTTVRTPPRTPTSPTTSSSRRTTPPRAPTRPTAPSRTIRRKPTVTQPLPSTTEQTILFHLRVDFSDASGVDEYIPAAEEFMIALIENLRSALREAFDQYSAKLNKQLRLADEEAQRAEIDLVQMQAKLRDISGSRDLSRQSILRDISTLRQKLQSTIMQRASDETLYEATVNRIAKEQAKRKQRADNDSITSELRSMLYVLTEAQKLYDSGRASVTDIQDIKEKIVRAKIELAQRREQIINPPGSIEISSLNDELATLSTKSVLAQQEISSFNEQLEEAEGLLKNADGYELLSLKADIARQSLEETLLWRARLGRNNRSIQPPDVTVIGAE